MLSVPCRLLLEPLLPLSATLGEFCAASPEQQADWLRRMVEACKAVGQPEQQKDHEEDTGFGWTSDGLYR